MSPFDRDKLIDSIYPADSLVRGILLSHSTAVCRLALAIAENLHLNLNPADIEEGAMLHDIGIIATNAPGIGCYGTEPYLCHGIIGADMLRRAGAPEYLARIAERHTGAGLTHQEIIAASLPLPLDRSYMPETLLEKLICYADCFYSKGGDGNRKGIERVRASMDKFGPEVRRRFEELHKQFGKGNKETI